MSNRTRLLTRNRFLSALSLVFCLVGAVSAADYKGVRVIAHRGAGFEFDENTLEACQLSYAKGIRGFEIDLRLTKDNQLVLMHDADVKRTTLGEGRVEAMTLAELTALRTRQSGVAVPSAAAVFDFFKDKPDVHLLLEMKTSDKKAYPDEKVEPYCRLLLEQARRSLPDGTYIFISFDRRALKAMHELAPDAWTGLLTSTPPTDELLEVAKELGCRRISMPVDATTRQFTRKVREAGLQVSLWPIRSKEDADLAVALGGSILCTDTPSDLLGLTAVPR